MATAKRLKKWVMPWMRPRSDGANQSCMARLATGKCTRLADAEQEPGRHERTEAGGRAGQHRRRRRPRNQDVQDLLGPEAIAEPADGNLACCVGPGERGEHETHLAQRQAERLADLGLCDGDDAPIEVADQVHQAEQHQHPPPRARGRDALVDPPCCNSVSETTAVRHVPPDLQPQFPHQTGVTCQRVAPASAGGPSPPGPRAGSSRPRGPPPCRAASPSVRVRRDQRLLAERDALQEVQRLRFHRAGVTWFTFSPGIDEIGKRIPSFMVVT